jgi:hypothetical protein
MCLQEQFLRQIFEHALRSAQQAAADVAAAGPAGAATAPAAAACTAAMKLMAAVLAWDFKATNSSFVSASSALRGATITVWRVTLLACMQWTSAVLAGCRSTSHTRLQQSATCMHPACVQPRTSNPWLWCAMMKASMLHSLGFHTLLSAAALHCRTLRVAARACQTQRRSSLVQHGLTCCCLRPPQSGCCR